jgi:hypothetical protein
MRLGQAAAALWVNEKTLDNAIRILGLPRPLDENIVRALGLAFRAKYRYGIPLKRGFPAVREALKRPAARENDAVVNEVMTYLPEVEARIEWEKRHYRRLPPGPGWRDPFHPEIPPTWRRHPAVRRALQWGLDLSLNAGELRHSVEERLRSASADEEATRLLQEGLRTHS